MEILFRYESPPTRDTTYTMEEPMLYESLLEAEDARDLQYDEQLDEGLALSEENMSTVGVDQYFAGDETSLDMDLASMQPGNMEFDSIYDGLDIPELDYKPSINLLETAVKRSTGLFVFWSSVIWTYSHSNSRSLIRNTDKTYKDI